MNAYPIEGLLRCLHCNYDLRGATTPVCPECGHPYSTSWICRSRLAGVPRWIYRHRELASWTFLLLVLIAAVALLAANQGVIFLALVSCVGIGYLVVTAG